MTNHPLIIHNSHLRIDNCIYITHSKVIRKIAITRKQFLFVVERYHIIFDELEVTKDIRDASFYPAYSKYMLGKFYPWVLIRGDPVLHTLQFVYAQLVMANDKDDIYSLNPTTGIRKTK